ncbi:hypothetical protein F4561_001473 [Lipingzhangella halophila]|uniref:Core-binding (CB) domain-containing protein n=1 Tax=Lipingzhangella halophila TaxID=1783352 RepID=A0A7W7RFF4_9ACTN|nr:site-specific integrase [Lipingzhangella halophila]MBB4930653.1 hypothetical protein [Lipingzhangella halophila]
MRYQRLDNTWASKGGFETKTAALNWGQEQEAHVRAGTWIDPKEQEITFGEFAAQWWAQARLSDNTAAKYRSYLDAHILPAWKDWPLIAIFNNHLEIQGWVNRLHDELAEPSVASVFALFSTLCNTAVRARRIPANPCNGVRVSSGGYETDRQVATPVQVLRAAMRLHHTFGRAGFVLCLLNAYTGARWSELVALESHEYDEVNHAIPVRTPLQETAGRLKKAKRAKTPAGKRWIPLPGFLNALYVDLRSAVEPGERCSPALRVGSCGAGTSVPGSGAPPGTGNPRARRCGCGHRSCPGSPSTRAATPTARGWPTTASPKSAGPRGWAIGCRAWPTSTNTSPPIPKPGS